MTLEIRPGRPDDREAIAAFTQDTFDWGDYVADAFPHWLEDPDGLVMVAVDADDRPIGLGRVVLLSPREAWLHAARVHPDHRRSGVGAALNRHGCDWARRRGAMVARLLIEDWNEPARRQVTKLGYRKTAPWVWADRSVGSGEVDPATNGGRRVPSEERLTPAPSAEVEPAWISWSTSQLAAVGRQLYALGWYFRRMTTDDVAAAARRRSLWQCPSGWVIADLEDEELNVTWVVTSDLDVERLLRAVVDRAEQTPAETVRVFAPRTEWMAPALERTGFEVFPHTIWSITL